MALEASIVERLQELRKWQIIQEERLLKQQQEQRELLSIEQERMYEALGMSMKDVIVDESIIDQMSVSKIKDHVETLKDNGKAHIKINEIPQETSNINTQRFTTSNNDSTMFGDSEEELNTQLNVPNVENDYQQIDETPKRFSRNNFERSIEEIEPLTIDKSLTKSVIIDEIPVPSPKMDFKTLLEEKLRDAEAMNVNDTSTPKNQIKRPFLRKGEGLARFQPNSALNKVKKPVRPRNSSRFSNSPCNKSQKINTKNLVAKPKVNIDNNNKKKVNEVSRKSIGVIPSVAQQKLVLSNVALPKKLVRNSRSLPPIPMSISPSNPNESTEKYVSNDESNQSDLDSSKLETKIFEMLEEKAENSSFCSTSSAVVAFMQQSTPLKLRNIRKNLMSQKQTKNQAKDQTDDEVLNEIVHTLKSNKLPSSQTIKIHETYAQKNTVATKQDSNSIANDNPPQTSTKNIQQSIKQIIQPTNQKNNSLHHTNNSTLRINYPKINLDVSNSSSIIDIHSLCESDCLDDRPNNVIDNNCKDTIGKIETNVSMHVRFAEYNEYKTIGLTDTSTLSTDSHSVAVRENENDHSECEESSDSETLPSQDDIISQRFSTNVSELKNQSLDQYDSRVTTNFIMNKEALTAGECNDDTENSDTNSIDQSSEDEQSEFNDSEGTYYDEDTTISEIQEAMAKVLNDNDSNVDKPLINPENSPGQQQLPVTNDTIFKSDLLKNRLLELEREIDIFRKENVALSLQRQKVQDEHRQLQREFKEKEVNLERERNQMNTRFQEEKKRLAREKSALENRLRDAREKSIQSKQERQEIQLLNEQLNELKDDIVEKESRWQALQARQRSQIRVLQMENSKLKLEIERLQATKRVNSKLKRPSTISNTKAIHQINKQLDGKRGVNNPNSIPDEELETSKIIRKKNPNLSPVFSTSTNQSPSSTVETEKGFDYNSIPAQKSAGKPTEESVSKKRQLYETLLKDAAPVYQERIYDESPIILEKNNDELDEVPSSYENKRDIVLKAKPARVESEFTTAQRTTDTVYQYQNKSPHNNDDSQRQNTVRINDERRERILNDNLESQQLIRGSYQQFVRDVITPRQEENNFISNNSYSNSTNNSRNSPAKKNSHPKLNYSSDRIKSRTDQDQFMKNKRNEINNSCVIEMESRKVEQTKRDYVNDRMKFICRLDSELTPRSEHQNPLPQLPDCMTPRPDQIQLSQISDLPTPKKFTSSSASSSPSTINNFREVKHPDGHTEYWYPNGNVKRIYPDRNITKMIYYNGDVRETTSDGCIKYFYAATKTWHTTYPDGFEIIEFPDGQQERRTKDGVVEVSFPDGSVRLMQPDGIEKWALPDGTIAETFPNGEKILSLPNGQREIHTKDHKRREYPDGTVKFVYPDGTQETRYSNGRIRIKDKEGNLVMDSYQT
ncbi:hypothetical protein PV327_001486 [Microctonus hyperodae]|uniref:Centromere protein J n=1 Tax=Microctonus hyperodae TaxID=165561 RepID=A0AA39L388_MICHY|nr:hypothetical protein PV327_001486 [Microctonus hyperodae]